MSSGHYRGQSHVVGIALLLGITVIALAGLTAGIGSLVGHNAASADAERVADALDDAHAPSETVGTRNTELPVGSGVIGTEQRTIRLFGINRSADPPPLGSLNPEHNATEQLAGLETDTLVYENEHRTVRTEAGAILVGGDSTRMYRSPPIHVDSRDDEPLLLGLSDVDADVPSLSVGERGARLSVTTAVEHERQSLSADEYRIAVETAHPDAWLRHFGDDIPTTTTDDLPGGNESTADNETTVVVAAVPGNRPAYLVVHRSTLGVRVG